MNQKVTVTIINVSNPAAFSGKGSRGGLGDVSLKRRREELLQQLLVPIRERRAAVAKDLAYVRDVLREGRARAQALTQSTLDEVRDGLGYFRLGKRFKPQLTRLAAALPNKC
jgi:tryptophanyl-tRNA synthetase